MLRLEGCECNVVQCLSTFHASAAKGTLFWAEA